VPEGKFTMGIAGAKWGSSPWEAWLASLLVLRLSGDTSRVTNRVLGHGRLLLTAERAATSEHAANANVTTT
jgi:hypothetical protein